MMPDPMMPLSTVIEDVQPEAYGISTFSMVFMNTAQSATYHFAPGQFNMIYLPGFGESPSRSVPIPVHPT